MIIIKNYDRVVINDEKYARSFSKAVRIREGVGVERAETCFVGKSSRDGSALPKYISEAARMRKHKFL